MRIRLIFREILPFYFRLVVLAAVTLFIDLILHLTDLVWIGRYLGIPGVILILLSFGHSLRKRGVIKSDGAVRLTGAGQNQPYFHHPRRWPPPTPRCCQVNRRRPEPALL